MVQESSPTALALISFTLQFNWICTRGLSETRHRTRIWTAVSHRMGRSKWAGQEHDYSHSDGLLNSKSFIQKYSTNTESQRSQMSPVICWFNNKQNQCVYKTLNNLYISSFTSKLLKINYFKFIFTNKLQWMTNKTKIWLFLNVKMILVTSFDFFCF